MGDQMDARTVETRPGHRRRRRSSHHLGAAIIILIALVAAACGGGRSEGSTEDGGGQPTEDTSAGGSEAAFGDLPSPCGPGDATGSPAQGVTDSTITIGYGDDAGFAAAPGLNHEQSDAVRAMIDWCNDAGGINGRQVEGIYYDAALTEVNNVMTQACDQVFMLVGQGFSLDSAQEELRRGCDLPSVPAFSVSPAFANAPDMYQPMPNPVDLTPVEIAATMAEAFPDEVKESAVVYANFASTIDTKDKVLSAYPQFGFEFLDCPQEYAAAGEADWKPFVQNLKDCGAEVVYFTGAPYPNFQNFLDAASQLEYDPIYIVDSNFYDPVFAAWNQNGLADKVYVRLTYVPLEEASSSKATQDYLDIIEAAGGDTSNLGEAATSAFLLWATAAQACGSDLTRDCVVSQLAEVHEWTGGGLHAPTDPGANVPPECGAVLKLEGTRWVRFAPEEVAGFNCDPSYVAPVTGPVVDRGNLDADRISQLG